MKSIVIPFWYMKDSSSLPIYKTRKFWRIIYSILFVSGISFYLFVFPKRLDVTIIEDFSLALGGGIFMLIGINSLGAIGKLLGAALYLILYGYVLHKLFWKNKLNLAFISVFTAVMCIGYYSLFVSLAGLS